LRIEEIKDFLNKGIGSTLPKISSYKKRNQHGLTAVG